jgi:hypothetical protein
MAAQLHFRKLRANMSESYAVRKGEPMMNAKSLFLIGTLALAGVANAKSYDIVLGAPAKAGSAHLAAGEYSLKVEGNTAIFTSVETGKKVSAAVKVQDSGKKFDQTAVDSTGDQITAIELGGSSKKLEMGE